MLSDYGTIMLPAFQYPKNLPDTINLKNY